MQSCRIDFTSGHVYLGYTVLDQWTDELFLKRVFPDFVHTHDFTGAAIYDGTIAMTMDDCHFNRIQIVCHKKRGDIPPTIQEIYFFLDARPDWADNKLFKMVQAHTNGPAVRPGSTYRITNPNVDVLASDAFGGRDAHVRFRYNNSEYSYNRTISASKRDTVSMRAGVIHLDGGAVFPGMSMLQFSQAIKRGLGRGVPGSGRIRIDNVELRGDFTPDSLHGDIEVGFNGKSELREILFRSNDFQYGGSRRLIDWLRWHFGNTDSDLVVCTAQGRVEFSPRAVGIKITYTDK
ncbi:MAG: hypothetical protein IJZ68_09400 [Bacteroidaceae bacterium]|nr:hypothetical protein [Bacteroidaceae bacterium]